MSRTINNALACLGTAIENGGMVPWSKYRTSKRLTPLQAVRHKCLDCCNEQPTEVKLCPIKDCALWPYRFGKYPPDHKGARSVLRPINLKCRACGPDTFKREDGKVRADWQVCQVRDCPLYHYRFAKNPARVGVG